MHFLCSVTKLSSLKLKTWLWQLLGSLPLDDTLPVAAKVNASTKTWLGFAHFCTSKDRPTVKGDVKKNEAKNGAKTLDLGDDKHPNSNFL